jgi:hypothetical protein
VQRVKVHQVCANWQEDRIIPRMARALAERLGWGLGREADPRADVLYLTGYFEAARLKPWPRQPVAAYFSHREEEPPNNAKARLWDQTAARVQLRVATCELYAAGLRAHGRTIVAAAPLEERFRLGLGRGTEGARAGRRPIVGLSGYTYSNRRKGEDLATAVVASEIGQKLEWRASGRGWPVPTKRLAWAEMPAFYQGLDILVCPSRVEGIPMPPLEALACGCSVVIPRGVGLLDELPTMAGIHRYERGDAQGLIAALEEAVAERPHVNLEALVLTTSPYGVDKWADDLCEGMLSAFSEQGATAKPAEIAEAQEANGIAGIRGEAEGAAGGEDPAGADGPVIVEIEEAEPVQRGTASTRGIYCVAFGGPARESALRMMESAKRHMPEIPIALCAAKRIGPEDVLVVEPDSDIGGRRAKLKAYELSPAEWESVLYLDADTEVVAPIQRYFQWIEAGWEFVICKDPHLMDTLHAYERRNNKKEMLELQRAVKTLHTLQYNGGVWAFCRNRRVAAFFRRWRQEWERYAQRDQGPLVRAMYTDPLKVLVLGNEWNTFPKYTKGIATAGLMHYPGDARRWDGLIPGRIDSQAAWQAVEKYTQKHRGSER